MQEIENPQNEEDSESRVPLLSDDAKKLVDLIVRVIVNATFREIEQ